MIEVLTFTSASALPATPQSEVTGGTSESGVKTISSKVLIINSTSSTGLAASKSFFCVDFASIETVSPVISEKPMSTVAFAKSTLCCLSTSAVAEISISLAPILA